MTELRRRKALTGAVLLVLILAFSSVDWGPGVARALPGAPYGPSPVPWQSAPLPPALGHLRSSAIGPAQPACFPGTSLLPYTAVAGVRGVTLWPLEPLKSQEAPCTVSWWAGGSIGQIGLFNDEAHMTFSSAVNGSATRWTLPLHLPHEGSGGIANFLNDFYAGFVVTGDTNSLYNQSLLQVVFTPHTASNGSLVYLVTLSIWSLHIGTDKAGFCAVAPWGLNLSWNNKYACEAQMLNSGLGVNLTGPIPADQFVDVTFNGASKSSGITVYVNDSTQTKFDASYTLNTANTGRTWTPEYTRSCEDVCYLNWSMPFGQGFGADLALHAFNTTLQNTIHPVEFGSAEYYTSTGYNADYANVSLESASGGCGSQAYTITCAPLLNIWEFRYPFFQFNGTTVAFGSGGEYPWATENFTRPGTWGYYQWDSQGKPNDVVPLWVDQLANDSRVGFLAPNTALNVTVRAQDLGSLTSLTLNYTLPNGTAVSASMTRRSGTVHHGIYAATIPAAGGNGLIGFYAVGLNHAGERARAPDRAVSMVQRGPIPSFTVGFSTLPGVCGSVIFNGNSYASGSSALLPANFYNARAVPCYPYVFKRWQATGVQLNSTTSQSILVGVGANGTLTAVWKYIRPFDHVNLRIDTNRCGAILLNGTDLNHTYAANTTVLLLDRLTVPLAFVSCAGNQFSGWIVSTPANITVLGKDPKWYLTLQGNGTVELTFVPNALALSLVFQVQPGYCGGILFRGAGYTNNASIAVRQGVRYPLAPDPCPHFGLLSWNATLGVTITGSASAGWNVSAQAPGTITATYYHLTEVTILTLPGTCGDVRWDGTPNRNGTILTVANHTTHTVFADPCPGFYFSGFYTNPTPGILVRGNAATIDSSGILEAVFHSGTPTNFIAFITDPGPTPSCTNYISFGGKFYMGSQYLHVPLNYSTTLVPVSCVGMGFVAWEVGGVGIAIHGTHVWVNGSGSITAHFHPLQELDLFTQPASCGTITLAGVNYTSGAKPMLPAPNTYRINVTPCAHFGFLYWLPSAGVNVTGPTLTMQSTGRIIAVFGPLSYSVILDVAPRDCGGIRIGLNQYVNNTTLVEPYGSYVVIAKPCSGFHLDHWSVFGAVSVSSPTADRTSLAIGGSGTLLATYRPVFPQLSLAAPSSAELGSAISLAASIATLVPPYNYTYDWAFGDGTSATTSAGFTTHTYAAKGTYIVTVTVHDPYGRVASSNATVQVKQSMVNTSSVLGLTALVAVGAGAAAVVAAVLLALRGGRGRAGATASAKVERPTDIEQANPERTEP